MRIVEEMYLPGHSVSLVARRHGIAGNQLFTWRRLMALGALRDYARVNPKPNASMCISS